MGKETTYTWKLTVIVLLTLIGCISIFFFKPIPQDPNFHLFADSRTFLSVPNALNALTNISFLMTGGISLIFILWIRPISRSHQLFLSICIFFLGIFLTGIGSMYYHYNPTNNTLVWDRLPMTICFMSFFSLVISEYISIRFGKILLYPLIFIGVLSIIYWNYTENIGKGDLRMYYLVQFLPMIITPIILLLFKTPHKRNSYIWAILLAYLLAKVFEFLDYETYELGYIISGHSIKHILASLVALIYLLGLYKDCYSKY